MNIFTDILPYEYVRNWLVIKMLSVKMYLTEKDRNNFIRNTLHHQPITLNETFERFTNIRTTLLEMILVNITKQVVPTYVLCFFFFFINQFLFRK